ncbi:MAG: hypothetical protein CVU10_10570 [Bacteroidetes bacterium HGW-Bacteroidetes-5]|jgi:hypothetical protein|nr:MAG: hypothetical protein CVU10_10570 [Bacteroidetes bacterium HGW-Bacteroidetes-5]
MRNYSIKSVITLVLTVLFINVSFSQTQSAVKKENLKVLFVGGTSEISAYAQSKPAPEVIEASVQKRMKAFETLLKTYFTEVTVIRAKEFREELSDNFDVTIIDGMPPERVPLYTEKDEKGNYTVYKNAGFLSEEFDNPTLMIADIPDRIGRRIGLKLDWYCLCLDAHAYNIDKSHSIFKGPFKVSLTMEELPTPKDALSFQKYYKDIIPATQQMWRVQTQGYMTTPDFRVGMVCRPWGFTDSPDTEVISGGVSLKSPDAIAIGRHGNFFHWGFAASPDYMTEEAKVVFANAVHYTSKLKGEKVIARKYDDRKSTRNEMFFVYSRSPKDSAVMSTNLPYLYMDKGSRSGLKIDEDAKLVGVATNNHLILDRAITMLEKGESTDVSQRILDRYTLVTFCSPKGYRDWYEKYKQDLFFTESGGFYFLVNPKSKPNTTAGKSNTTAGESNPIYGNDYSLMLIERAARGVKVGETDNLNPVNAAVTLVRLDNGEIAVVARVKIEKGFHIYAKVSEREPYIETVADFVAPEGYKPYGERNTPASIKYGENGTFIYEGDFIFYQKFLGKGPGQFKFNFAYQCCDDQICMPPVEREFLTGTLL